MSDSIRTFHDLFALLDGMQPLNIAVAAAEDEMVLEALSAAVQRGWITARLTGDPGKLARLLQSAEIADDALVIEPVQPGQAATRAVELVRNGDSDLLMKGKTSTAELMHAVLHAQTGLRRDSTSTDAGATPVSGRMLSHMAVVQTPQYSRLMLCTDGGVNIEQSLPVLRDILCNSLEMAYALRIAQPNVAALALVETVTEKLPETRLARCLAEEAAGDAFGPCVVEGPVALDVALSEDAARHKQLESRIAGCTDVFLFPNITAANFTVKGLMSAGGALGGGLVLGAIAPIILLSRSDSPGTRLHSIALALAVSLYYSRQHAFGKTRQIDIGLS